jgi:histone deacetylase 11
MNARPDLLEALAGASRPSLGWIAAGQLPVVYHDQYNISFFGLEKLHPFDSCKYRKVVNALASAGALTKEQLVAPREATDEMLLDVHSDAYVQVLPSCCS